LFPLASELSGSPGGGGTDLVVAKISDSGTDGPPSLQFASNVVEVDEDAGSAVLIVTRSGSLAGTATVAYATAPGTATAPADFTAKTGTLTFGPGESALALTVAITNDAVAEGQQAFTVNLQTPSSGSVLGYPSTATVTINDEDGLSRQFKIKDRVLAVGPHWTATKDVPWIALNLAAGNGPSTVTVTVNPTGLAVGTYTGTITVTGDTGDSPQFVAVTLEVVP
jgi:hypothetical protein